MARKGEDGNIVDLQFVVFAPSDNPSRAYYEEVCMEWESQVYAKFVKGDFDEEDYEGY